MCWCPCSLDYTGSGDDVMVTTATGYTFSGSREGVTAVEADAKADYLLFGVWLDEVADGDDEGRRYLRGHRNGWTAVHENHCAASSRRYSDVSRFRSRGPS